MNKLMLLAALTFAFAGSAFAQTCALKAAEVKPVISGETRKQYDEKLAKAFTEFDRTKGSADTRVWLGRRIAYLGNYKDAVRVFGRGIELYPNDARFYRHRGHRLLTLRCFDDAIKDFEKAVALVKSKPDEVEPDGLPNAKNIPTSTLQTNIFYHLGLAYYLKGDNKKALAAFDECEKLSKNPDMLVATKHWQYMILRRLGREKDAAKSVEAIADDLEIIENGDYYKLVKMYRGKTTAESLLAEINRDPKTLGGASLAYGVGNWFLYNGQKAKAFEIFRKIPKDQWSSFGYIAAEADLKRSLS